MPTLELLFIVIISILVVSVVLSIIDWISLSSLSSKTQLLEREVEKKTIEFDALKKDRANARQPTISSATVIESSEPMATTENMPPPQQSVEDTIQIVRNVRGNFERTEHFTHNISPYPQESAGENPQPQSNPASAPPPAAASAPDSPPNVQSGSAVHSIPPKPPEFSENNIPQPSAPALFRLYSDTKHDADFQALWHNITGLFERCAHPRIIIDLTGINFMYDKEMDYLEKIKYLLTGRGGSLEFINCDRELLSIFTNRSQLRSVVHQKVL